jgi:accessory gene regulator B
MQKKVVDWLYNLQSRWGILKEEERSLYEYAYRLLLSRILIYSIIIALGIITGNWLEMFSFLLPFVILRQYVGGIHLEKISSCMIVSSIIIFFNTQYLTAKPSLTVPIIILGLVADGIVYMLAPVDNGNKKLDEVEKQIYGKKAKIILMIECIVAFVLYFTQYAIIAKGIVMSHIVLAFGLILGETKIFFGHK